MLCTVFPPFFLGVSYGHPDLSRVLCAKAEKLSLSQQSDLAQVLRLAHQDRFLFSDTDEGIREGEFRMAVLVEDTVVGFFSPKRQSFMARTHWRAGALFLLPAWRGQGVMERALSNFFSTHHPALSWIDDTNAASRKLFGKLGFTQGKPKAAQDGGQGHWYVLTAPPRLLAMETRPAYLHW